MPARSSAWTLALIFAALIVYASLYPFEGWRVQGVGLLDFLGAPWPQYWTGFDLVSNLLGYHHACWVMLRKFRAGQNRRNHVWYRWFNEAPVIMMVIAVALVVVKPF